MLKQLIRSVFRAAQATPASPAAPATAPVPSVAGPRWTYSADGFATTHNASFLADRRFQQAYRLGAQSGHRICRPEELHIEWRVYVCCWAAQHALRLIGDFVECGVSTGIVSRAVANYVEFEKHERKFWLIDTFEGIPLAQATVGEQSLAVSKNERHYFDCYDAVRSHFASYGNVNVIKGRVPEVLPSLQITQVAYLHIDMNIAAPEVAAITHFWNLLAPGAVVVLDDYGSLAHVEQKTALDAFAREHTISILTLPTGQGLMLKP